MREGCERALAVMSSEVETSREVVTLGRATGFPDFASLRSE
jgi:hypothetical protein